MLSWFALEGTKCFRHIDACYGRDVKNSMNLLKSMEWNKKLKAILRYMIPQVALVLT